MSLCPCSGLLRASLLLLLLARTAPAPGQDNPAGVGTLTAIDELDSLSNAGVVTGEPSMVGVAGAADDQNLFLNTGILEGGVTDPGDLDFDLLINQGIIMGTVSGVEEISNAGHIDGDVSGVVTAFNEGDLFGSLTFVPSLGPESAVYFQKAGASATDILMTELGDAFTFEGGAVGTIDTLGGNDEGDISGGATVGIIQMGEGDDTLQLQNGQLLTRTDMGGGNDTVLIRDGIMNQLSMGEGTDRVVLNRGVVAGSLGVNAIDFGQDEGVFRMTGGSVDGLIQFGSSGDTVELISGEVGEFAMGEGNDNVELVAGVVGRLDLGGGEDILTMTGGAIGLLEGSLGSDQIQILGGFIERITDATAPGPGNPSTLTIGRGATIGTARATTSIEVSGGDPSQLSIEGVVFGEILYSGEFTSGTNEIDISGAVLGVIRTSSGDDSINVTGLSEAGMDLGAGDDVVSTSTSGQIRDVLGTGILLGEGNDRYFGRGILEGTLFGGGGDDTFDLSEGSLTGFDAGGGDDRIDLRLDTVTFVNPSATVGLGGGHGGVGDVLNLSAGGNVVLTEDRFTGFEAITIRSDLNSAITLQGNQVAESSIALTGGHVKIVNDDFLDEAFIRRTELGGADALRTARVNVNSGAELSGNGLIELTGGVNELVIDGVLSPGEPANRIGQISIQGNYVQGAGGEIDFDVLGPGPLEGTVDSNKTHDLVRIAGQATLNGGILKVRTNGDTFRALTRWVVLDTSGGVEGTLRAEVLDATNLDATTRVKGNDLELVLKRNDLEFARTVSEDPLVGRYGPILDDALRTETPEFVELLNELSILGPGERGAVIQSVFAQNPLISIGQFTGTVTRRLDLLRSLAAGSPERAAGPRTASTRTRSRNRLAAVRQLSQVNPMPILGTVPDLVAGFAHPGSPEAPSRRRRTKQALEIVNQSGEGASEVEPPAVGGALDPEGDSQPDEAAAETEEADDPANGTWAQAFGIRSERDFGVPFRLQGSGATVGFDRQITRRMTAGMFAGASESRGSQGASRTQIQEVRTENLGAYVSYSKNHAYIDVVYDRGVYDIDATRLVAAGALTSISTAGYGAREGSLYSEAGWLYEPDDLLYFQPTLSLQRRSFDQDRIVETGGVAGTVTFEPLRFQTHQSGLGLRLFRVWKSADGTLFLPELKARWLHNFDHEGIFVQQRLASTASIVEFRTEDVSDENTGQFQVGITAYAKGNIEFNGTYYGEFGQNTEIHAASATVAYRF